MKKIKLWLVCRACDKRAHSARITIHILALVTGHENMGRAWAGILREFSR